MGDLSGARESDATALCKKKAVDNDCRAIAFENQKIIMEVQEEIISSWWVQGKALLKMCGVSQKRMLKHSRTPHRFVPRRGTLWEGGRPTCTVSLVATVKKLANAIALIMIALAPVKELTFRE
ncbi:hypothetical protein [Candidatus Magnetaquicoccus inordinatus]|uniref:hypothetical protein n=1 Tax=Candidatus Magnetaquicoccus inordinatus TaxID=2496818 RepID=UPI00187D2663|nr:hypothetical protein [Candidatus Magnetaquicoccus inordinatus]